VVYFVSKITNNFVQAENQSQIIMNNLKKPFLSLLVFAVVQFSCETKKEQSSETTESASIISLIGYTDSPEFADAILEMNSPAPNSQLAVGKVNFNYEVTNYQLTAQTLDADIKQCANSPEGQHIHLILNNEPYTAHYSPNFEMDLKEGHYVALSFLSRSYHESLKNPQAYVLRQFTVGDVEAPEADLTAPHLFFSRPKGSYVGKSETDRVILDFYLINTDLSPEGNKVQAVINGQTFIIEEWKPFFMEGLPMGENTVELTLIDANGEKIEGPFNHVKRTFTLKEE
jgi:hypothetical protein